MKFCRLFLILLLVSACGEAPQKEENNNTEEQSQTQEAKAPRSVSDILSLNESDIAEGDENAPVTIIEYSSFTCPHCSYYHRKTYPDIKKNYIDTGKVLYIMREFSTNKRDYAASILARCAGERRNIFANVIFARHNNWAYDRNYQSILTNIGILGGVGAEEYAKCMADKNLGKPILQNTKDAAYKLGLAATPVFFINGKEFKSSASYEIMSKEIDKIIKTKAEAK